MDTLEHVVLYVGEENEDRETFLLQSEQALRKDEKQKGVEIHTSGYDRFYFSIGLEEKRSFFSHGGQKTMREELSPREDKIFNERSETSHKSNKISFKFLQTSYDSCCSVCRVNIT